MRFAILLTCAFSLCASALAVDKPTGYVLSGVPLVRQTYNACGPASITEVLSYFGSSISMQEVSRATRPTEYSYMSSDAITKFAPTVGMEARLYVGGSLSTVKTAIKNSLPVIALQNVVYKGRTIPHWRVVTGYDDANEVVYIMDPLMGYISVGYIEFKTAWESQRGFFAVMYPPNLSANIRKLIG